MKKNGKWTDGCTQKPQCNLCKKSVFKMTKNTVQWTGDLHRVLNHRLTDSGTHLLHRKCYSGTYVRTLDIIKATKTNKRAFHPAPPRTGLVKYTIKRTNTFRRPTTTRQNGCRNKALLSGGTVLTWCFIGLAVVFVPIVHTRFCCVQSILHEKH